MFNFFPEACNIVVPFESYIRVYQSKKFGFYLGVNYVSGNFLFITPRSRSSSPLPTGAGATWCSCGRVCRHARVSKVCYMLPQNPKTPWDVFKRALSI